MAREDAGDRWLGSTKAQRLQREIAALKPGDNVSLKVYANGQFRDVTVKAARAADLPRSGAMMFMGREGLSGGMMPMPARPMAPMPPVHSMDDIQIDVMPELRAHLEAVRPQLERLRMEMPRALKLMRATPRVHMGNMVV